MGSQEGRRRVTRAQLRTELLAEGFDFLSVVRANQFINDAYRELCGEDFWTFLEETAAGAAPLTISDLRTVESVIDTANNSRVLAHRERRALRESEGDLTTTGTPRYYYVDAGSIVRTYPVGGTLAVDYWKVPAEMDDDDDEPIVPSQYHRLILHMAVREACLDRGDAEHLARVSALNLQIDRRLETMRENLAVTHRDGDYVTSIEGGEDA